MHSRRNLLKLTGSTIATGALLGSAGAEEVASKPAMNWDPAYHGNYRSANRTVSDIRWIVLHTIQGPATAGIGMFKKPGARVSAHFVVGSNGGITKMVRIDDVAWSQGNGPYNDTGVGIEMAGYADQTDFSEAMYDSVASLVAYLADTYDVPKRHPTFDVAPCSAYDGRGGIIGHEQIPSPYDCSKVVGGKYDPGTTWDWDYFIRKVRGGGGTGNTGGGNSWQDDDGSDGTGWNDDGSDGSGWGTSASETFDTGQRVASTAHLNVRDSANGRWTATVDPGTTGRVRGGPEIADGYTWWQIEWQVGSDRITGWSAEQYLRLAANSDDRTERDAGGAGDTSGSSEDEVDHSDSDTDSDWSWDDDSDDSDTDSDWSWDDDSDDSDTNSDWSWDDDSDDSDTNSDWSQDDSDDSSSDGDSDATFQIGTEVESTAQLNVRASAAGRWKATVDAGTTGWVKDGYVTADLHGRSYTWWKVEWDTGYNRVTGWCVETYIEKASNYVSSSFW